jgi:hypothetical protein
VLQGFGVGGGTDVALKPKVLAEVLALWLELTKAGGVKEKFSACYAGGRGFPASGGTADEPVAQSPVGPARLS